jgi:multidrug efflux pump subunit AcrB
MLRRVVAAALHRRRATLAGFAVAAAVGFAALPSIDERALAPTGPPLLQVRTEAPDLSADDVERLISGPLERDLAGHVSGLVSVRSTSRAGLSILDLRFRVHSSAGRDLDAVADRLARATVPGTPLLGSPADRLAWVGLHASLSPGALAAVVNDRIRPALLTVAGVNNVWLWGENEPLLVIEQLRGVNAVAVSERVQQRLTELAAALPQVQFDPHVYRSADYLHAAHRRVARALAGTAAAALIALAVLLLDWRRTVLVAVAVPIPVLAGVAALRAHAGALDAMTLIGLAALVPLILFDAVVFGAVGARAHRDPAQDAVARLTSVVGRLGRAGALLAVALLPVLFLRGFPERAFLPRAAGLFAVGLVALAATTALVVPALLATLPGGPARSPARPLVRAGHDRFLAPLARPVPAVLVLAGLLAAGAVASSQVATVMRPSFADRTLTARLVAWPGGDQAGLSGARDRVADRVRALPGVQQVTALPDCAAVPSGDGPACAALAFTLAPGTDRTRAVAAVNAAIRADSYGMSGQIASLLETPQSAARPSRRAALVVRVSGDHRAALEERAEAVRAAMSTVPGVLAPAVVGTGQVIEHRGTVAVLDVEAGITGRAHGAVRTEVARALARLQPAVGTEVHLLDAGPDRHHLIVASLAVGAAVLLFLIGALGAAAALVLGLLGVPAVLGAGIVGLWLDGTSLSPGGLAGLVVLGGLTLRVGFLLVPGPAGARATESGRDAARAMAVPTLQACAVLAVSTVPLLLAGRHAGTEELHEFAVVICAGAIALGAVAVIGLPGLLSRGLPNRKRGRGPRPVGPIGEAEAPMSVTRWIDEVDTPRAGNPPGVPTNEVG